MISTNLPILMAKHKVRSIKELSEKTRISRTTLTALYYGKGKGVQYETLEVLCGFFNVGIGDIIERVDNAS